MPNALEQNGTPPPAPDTMQAQPQQPGQGPNAQQPQAQPMPAPSHAEAVAALKHFEAIESELVALMKNPGLGKTDAKKSIIDGVTKLVANQVMSASQAVAELAKVPERPFEQKQWVAQHLQTIMQAQMNVLDHHRVANPGTGDWDAEAAAHPAYAADNHADTLSGIMRHYKPSATN